jgi:hypothetical protein
LREQKFFKDIDRKASAHNHQQNAENRREEFRSDDKQAECEIKRRPEYFKESLAGTVGQPEKDKGHGIKLFGIEHVQEIRLAQNQ